MFFRNLPFSRCLLWSSVSIPKRAVFLFSLYVSFRIDTLTLVNVRISCFFNSFINPMSASNFSNFVFFYSRYITTSTKSCPCLFLICLKILFRAFNFITKSITRSLIILKKPRKMTNDFFNNYICVHMFQWASSEFLNKVTITVKVAVVTYILKLILTKIDIRVHKYLRWNLLRG